MKLVRAHIQQFRSIREMTLELQEACIVLLGINETGKSNILRALSLLSPAQPCTADDVRQARADEAEDTESSVTFTVAPSEADFEACRALMKARGHGLAETARLKDGDDDLDVVAFATRYAKQMPYTVAVPSASRRLQYWQPSNKTFGVQDGWLVTTKAAANVGFPIEGIGGVTGSSVPLLRVEKRAADLPDTFFRAATARDVENLYWSVILEALGSRLPECIPWSYQRDSVLPASTPLEEFARSPAQHAALKNMFNLGEVPDVAAALKQARARTDGVRNLLDRVSIRVSQHLRKLWAGSPVSIVLTEHGPDLRCAIRDEHGVYDFQRRSDGFRRFASFMLMVSTRALAGQLQDALLLYDEPDASLHPAAARQLRDELLRMSGRCKVVYSTHSIFMVDPENVGRHLLVKRVNEETTVERAKPGNVRDEEVLYQAVGHTIFAELREMNILLEGYRDRRLIEVAMSDPRTNGESAAAVGRAGRCHTRGVKNISGVTAMLDLVGRSYIIVTDGDAPALDKKKEYSGAAPWVVYPDLVGDPNVVTAEDFVTLERLRSSVAEVARDFPELAAAAAATFVPEKSFMRQLDASVGATGVAKDRRKEILNAVKGRVFDGLTAVHLRPSATLLVERLAAFVAPKEAQVSTTPPSA